MFLLNTKSKPLKDEDKLLKSADQYKDIVSLVNKKWWRCEIENRNMTNGPAARLLIPEARE